ncbi:triose-phosphate isomerase [Candidatus Sumerlaeota bacterium]|nr:triose-phosphate isomerase [Candidatus Sumerlaeota bacterium]
MRIPFIAGNWKMYMTRAEAKDLVEGLLTALANVRDVEVAVCPPFTALDCVSRLVANSRIALGAQNCYWEDKGAFTGEVAAPLLKEIGCKYCIVGHSERRQYFGETNETVRKRILALYKHGILPILCIGETLKEREKGQTEKVVLTQLRECLQNLPPERVVKTTVAYEPVWAIGTGKTATPQQAQEVHALIRAEVVRMYGKDVAEGVRIQYGGSVKPDNIKELMDQEDIDGALVGGASLKVDSFAPIVRFAE